MMLIWVLAGIYFLKGAGLDVTPILASASVVGLAVAFGAQALIKGFFYGFFILWENQYTIGDFVDLEHASGTVESISLRITTLRDLEGVVHYVPNGTVGRISNSTQGWSRVLLNVGVSYDTDTDHASGLLKEILDELNTDNRFAHWILEEPVVCGVQELADSSVNIRLLVKTVPGKQWELAREIRRRVKRRFDDEGIEIPFPQRVVHHVNSGAVADPTTPPELAQS